MNDDTLPGLDRAAASASALRPAAIGWWGKLSTAGDFVGQGLPAAWLQAWDVWLQRGLGLAVERLGRDALRQRLPAMPPWQVLVTPGAAPGPQGNPTFWLGVVVPSADRVGRVFPMLLAEAYAPEALAAVPLDALRGRALRLADWLDQTGVLASPDEFAVGAAAIGADAWRSTATGHAAAADPLDGMTVGALCAAHPQAGSFWWRPEPVGPVGAASVESWPPRDSLVLDWLAGESTLPPAPPPALDADGGDGKEQGP